MTTSRRYLVVFAVAVFVAGFTAGTLWQPDTAVQAQSNGKVFELRTYTTLEGKLPNLLARFRDHTRRIFEKHGITNVGYWVPQDAPESDNTLIYIIAHDSRDAATESWKNFIADPEWTEVSRASQVDGRILASAPVSVFMEATDFSGLN
ncbi:MAG: NIPSNAP family protein [Acidobacteria bacterium]|nr:MAG: NIPSNAP family protein [Acidobacteriota bacterium]